MEHVSTNIDSNNDRSPTLLGLAYPDTRGAQFEIRDLAEPGRRKETYCVTLGKGTATLHHPEWWIVTGPFTGMNDLMHVVTVPIGQNFRAAQVEWAHCRIKRAVFADGDISVRRGHRFLIDAICDENMLVLGHLGQKSLNVLRRQMLEHMFADQKVGRGKIQFNDVPQEKLYVGLRMVLVVVSNVAFNNIEPSVIDTGPIDRSREFPVTASCIYDRADVVVLHELLQERSVN